MPQQMLYKMSDEFLGSELRVIRLATTPLLWCDVSRRGGDIFLIAKVVLERGAMPTKQAWRASVCSMYVSQPRRERSAEGHESYTGRLSNSFEILSVYGNCESFMNCGIRSSRLL